MDDEHSANYSDLFLAAQKLERWAEARDPLLLKTTTTGGSNVSQPQALGNLFPSRKLQGNHTFTAQSTILESIAAEEDSSVKPEEEEEAESSDEEDPEILSRIGGADHQSPGQLYHHFCQCGWAVSEEKIKIVWDVVVLTTSWKIVQRISARLPKEQV